MFIRDLSDNDLCLSGIFRGTASIHCGSRFASGTRSFCHSFGQIVRTVRRSPSFSHDLNYPICSGSCFVQTCGSSCRGPNRDIYRPRGGDVLAYSTPSSARLDQEKRSSLGKTYESLITLCPCSFRLSILCSALGSAFPELAPVLMPWRSGLLVWSELLTCAPTHRFSILPALPARCQRLMSFPRSSGQLLLVADHAA